MRGSIKLVEFSILYCGAAMEVKAIAVPAPMLGSTATIVDSNWKKAKLISNGSNDKAL